MASKRRERQCRAGRSIFVIGDYVVGDEDDYFTEKLRQDSRLLPFSKNQVTRRSSWYVNHCNLVYERKLRDAGKLIKREHQMKVNEIERSQDKISKLHEQYQKKIRKSVSLPDIEETRPAFENLTEGVFTRAKLSEIDTRCLPWKKDGSAEGFRTPLLKRRISLRESVFLSTDFSDEEDESTLSKSENDSKALTKSMQSSILSSRNQSSQNLTKSSVSKLPPLRERTEQPAIVTPEYEEKVAKQQDKKLTQHQKRLNDWRQNESYRSELMWDEFERIMRCFSEYLHIEYKPGRKKQGGVLQKDQQTTSEQPRSLLENTAYIRSFYFPHGEPDEIVFKH